MPEENEILKKAQNDSCISNSCTYQMFKINFQSYFQAIKKKR